MSKRSWQMVHRGADTCVLGSCKSACWKSICECYSDKGHSTHRSTKTKKTLAYLSFRCMTSVQRGEAGKGMLDWDQTLKGFKNKKHLTTEINHWSYFLCGVSHKMMLNRNAKENARDDSSFGRPPRMIHTAQDYDHKI